MQFRTAPLESLMSFSSVRRVATAGALSLALIAGAVMGVFEYFIRKKGKVVLENFSLAASMLAAMAAAVILGLMA